MHAPRPTRFSVPVVVGLSAAGLLALLCIPGLRPRDFLAAHWRAGLATQAERQVAPTLRKLLELGDDQLDFVVQQLTSEDPRRVRPAAQLLDEQLTRWKLLPSREATPKVAELAHSLARHAPEIRGEAKELSSDLATRILIWPLDRQAAEPGQVIANCETILREAGRRDLTTPRRPTAVADRQSAATILDPATESSVSSEAIELVAPPLPPLAPVTTPGESQADREPQLFPAATASGKRAVTLSLRDDLQSAGPPELPTVPSPAARTEPQIWSERTTLEVIERLQSEDVLEAAQAAVEFRRRGFSEPHVRLAEKLVSPDRDVRLRLAEALPQTPGIDARPWLIWLSQDDDPQVRLAALGIMATSSDAAYRKRIRQMELEESDAAVLQQVKRALR